MTGSVSAELVALANSLADAARPIAARYFRTPVTVDDKADQSPVTIADREAETAMRTLLDNAGEAPPFIAVGAELGAAFAEHFAARYPDDVAALANALECLLSDADLRTRLAAGARERRTQLPSWDDAVARFIRVLDTLAPTAPHD